MCVCEVLPLSVVQYNPWCGAVPPIVYGAVPPIVYVAVPPIVYGAVPPIVCGAVLLFSGITIVML